jgi:HSP20 family molecular chaperone IbpA
MRERISGSRRRIIALSTDVRDEDAKASFRDGVREVTFKKTILPGKAVV